MLPTELERAAHNLAERFQMLRVPVRSVDLSEWSAVAPSERNLVPAWLCELLSRHCLAGGVLEYRDRSRPQVRLFSFFDPQQLSSLLAEGSLARRLLDHQYFPFAAESDGSVWVVPFGEAPGSISLLDVPNWDGGLPSINNGLVFPASGLEFLLASMAVSEASYYASAQLPGFVMWYRATRG